MYFSCQGSSLNVESRVYPPTCRTRTQVTDNWECSRNFREMTRTFRKQALLGHFREISESEHFWVISEKFQKASTFHGRSREIDFGPCGGQKISGVLLPPPGGAAPCSPSHRSRLGGAGFGNDNAARRRPGRGYFKCDTAPPRQTGVRVT